MRYPTLNDPLFRVVTEIEFTHAIYRNRSARTHIHVDRFPYLHLFHVNNRVEGVEFGVENFTDKENGYRIDRVRMLLDGRKEVRFAALRCLPNEESDRRN